MSNLILNTFTEQELTNVVNNSNQDLIKSSFVINYLKKCDSIISNWKMSDETKDFIKSGFGLIASFIPEEAFKDKE